MSPSVTVGFVIGGLPVHEEVGARGHGMFHPVFIQNAEILGYFYGFPLPFVGFVFFRKQGEPAVRLCIGINSVHGCGSSVHGLYGGDGHGLNKSAFDLLCLSIHRHFAEIGDIRVQAEVGVLICRIPVIDRVVPELVGVCVFLMGPVNPSA